MKTAHSLRGFEEKMEPMFFDSENYQKTESEGFLIPRFSKNQNLASLNIS
jgi:hypothetical protein